MWACLKLIFLFVPFNTAYKSITTGSCAGVLSSPLDHVSALTVPQWVISLLGVQCTSVCPTEPQLNQYIRDIRIFFYFWLKYVNLIIISHLKCCLLFASLYCDRQKGHQTVMQFLKALQWNDSAVLLTVHCVYRPHPSHYNTDEWKHFRNTFNENGLRLIIDCAIFSPPHYFCKAKLL